MAERRIIGHLNAATRIYQASTDSCERKLETPRFSAGRSGDVTTMRAERRKVEESHAG